MPPNSAERNLLFGLLALQTGLIDQARLVAAFQAWALDKSRAMADVLTEQGALDADDRQAVEALVARHLKKHGDDPETSLARLGLGASTRRRLEAVNDPDLHASLAAAGRDPSTPPPGDDDGNATHLPSVGTTSSDGQRFRVIRPHARGGLGAVFVALDGELRREVALKQIRDEHADEPTSRQRFLLEAEITGGLEHPGIVPVYGLGTYGDGRPFYAMRFVKGDSLQAAIERFHSGAGPGSGTPAPSGPASRAGRAGEPSATGGSSARTLAFRNLLRRFTDVCNAIDYAHSRGVLHRDIKPGNVIVGKYGETLVVDWGLAKARGHADPGFDADGERPLAPSSSGGSAETLPGSALGTPGYMSPEQAEGNLDALGPASDVYSLGATLYHLLTGRPPFLGPADEAFPAAVRGEFPRPRDLSPEVDPALEAVCLIHNPPVID